MSLQVRKTRIVCDASTTTPLGLPVVPEVKKTSATSSGPTAAMRASTRRPDRRADGDPLRRSPASRRGESASETIVFSVRRLRGRRCEHPGVVGAEETVGDDEQFRGAAGEDVARLLALEARVQRDEGGAGRDQPSAAMTHSTTIRRPDRLRGHPARCRTRSRRPSASRTFAPELGEREALGAERERLHRGGVANGTVLHQGADAGRQLIGGSGHWPNLSREASTGI